MSDELALIVEDAQDSMIKAPITPENELVRIRAGKANHDAIGFLHDYYNTNVN